MTRVFFNFLPAVQGGSEGVTKACTDDHFAIGTFSCKIIKRDLITGKYEIPLSIGDSFDDIPLCWKEKKAVKRPSRSENKLRSREPLIPFKLAKIEAVQCVDTEPSYYWEKSTNMFIVISKNLDSIELFVTAETFWKEPS
ncbi:hypothetical protein J6590_060453 [Homalodisca vitripennis]|nr:hypothetical protein J6590_060453 [Homalodisca vitripennis]